MGKKMVALLVCIMLLSAVVVGCSQPQQFVNIATGGTAGTYFPLGGAFAEIWNKNIKNVNATAQSTGASTANVNMLKEGKVEVIFVQNDIAYYAATGTEMFKDAKYEDIKGLVTLYPETIQIVARADKNIATIADLKGKKIAVGAAGSGTVANARQILEAADITFEDIKAQYLSFAEAANNIKDGNIDAAFLTAGYPTAAVQDIAAQQKIVIVQVDDAIADKLIQKYPFYTKQTIVANAYNGVVTDSKTVAVKAMLAVSSKMKDDLAYQLVRTLYANTDRIKAAHKVGEQITKATGKDGMPIKLHPGAEKAFSEK